MAKTLADLLISLSLDSSNVESSITKFDAQLTKLQNTFRSSTSGMVSFEKVTGQLKSAVETLSDRMAAQEEKAQKLKTRLEEAREALSQAAQNTAKLEAELSDAEKAFGKNSEQAQALRESLDEAKDSQAQAAKQAENLESKLNRAREKVAQTEQALQSMVRQLELNSNALYQMGVQAEGLGQKLQSIAKPISSLGDKLTLGLTTPIAALGAASVKSAIDFESAFAGVRKTVSATESELQGLSDAILEMSERIPMSAQELSGIMELGGQLGVSTGNLERFTETIAALGVSTNLTNEAAATMFAQFANITGMDLSHVDRLGSTVVALGNNFATTESAIMEMGMRLAGAGKQIGLSQSEILGFSAALSSVGLEAQAGGSAFSRAMIQMQLAVETGSSSLDDFAKVSGMSAEEFAAAWETAPAQAISAFIQGLARMGEEGVSSIRTLEEMGLSEINLRDTLMRATTATDLFADAQETANAAWEKNSALTNEASQRYATTESQITMLKNAASNLAAEFGRVMIPSLLKLVENLRKLIERFGQMNDKQKETVVRLAAVTAAIGPLLSATGKLISTVGSISKGVGALLQVLAKLATTCTAATVTSAALTAGVVAVGAAAAGALVGLAALQARIYETSDSVENLTRKAQGLDEAFAAAQAGYDSTIADTEALSQTVDTYITRLEELEAAGLNTAASQAEYRAIVEELNALIPDLNLVLDEQTGRIVGGTQAIREQTEAWKEQAMQLAMQEKLAEIYDAYADAALEALEVQKKLNAAQEEGGKLSEKAQRAYKKVADALGVTVKELDGYTAGQWEAAEATLALDPSTADLLHTFRELQQQIYENELQTNEYAEALDVSRGIMAGHEEEVNAMQASYEALAGGMDAASSASGNLESSMDSATSSAQAQSSALNDNAEAVQAYADRLDTLTTAAQNVTEPLTVFTATSESAKSTVQSMTETLRQNAEALNQWESNIEELSGKLDEGLLKALIEAGPEKMGEAVANLAQAARDGESFDELNQAFEESGDAALQALIGEISAAEGIPDSVTEMLAQITGTMDEDVTVDQSATQLISDVKLAMDTAVVNCNFVTVGENIGNGVAQGLRNALPAVQAAAAAIIAAASAAMNAAAQIASPSKLTMKTGLFMGEGLAAGLERMKAKVRTAGAQLSKAATDAITQGTDLQGAASRIRRGNLTAMQLYAGAGKVQNTATRGDKAAITVNQYMYRERRQTAKDLARETRNGLRRVAWSL